MNESSADDRVSSSSWLTGFPDNFCAENLMVPGLRSPVPGTELHWWCRRDGFTDYHIFKTSRKAGQTLLQKTNVQSGTGNRRPGTKLYPKAHTFGPTPETGDRKQAYQVFI
jgi:hypothetical protein